jgi:hypothetical protein
MPMTRRGFFGALAGLAAAVASLPSRVASSGPPAPRSLQGQRVRVRIAPPELQPMFPGEGQWGVGDTLMGNGFEATCIRTADGQLAQAWMPEPNGRDGTVFLFRHSGGVG